MKKTKLLTSLVALALVLSLGACDVTECDEVGEAGGVGSVEEKDYKISFESNGYAYALGLAESADEGDKVEFKVTVESGFVIDEVSAVYLIAGEESAIEVEESAGAYSFVMPASDVIVKASAVGGYFKAWYDEDAEVITDYNEAVWKQSDLIRGFYELETGIALSTDTSAFVQAGDEVLVVPYRQYTLGDYELYANGEKLELVEDEELNAGLYAYRLVMPANDCEITVKVTERLVSVSFAEDQYSGYVDAYFYLESAPDDHLQSVSGLKVANDKVYVHAEPSSSMPEGYGIGKIISTANTYAVPQQYGTATTETTWDTDWLDKATISGDFKYVGEDEVYYEIPKWYFTDNEIKISFEVSYQQYAGYDFVGDWAGWELWMRNPYGSTQQTLYIDNYGKVSGSAISSSITSYDSEKNTLTFADGRPFYMSPDGKIAATNYNPGSSINTNDIYVFAKTGSDSVVSFQSLSIWGEIQYVLEVFVDGESWGYIYGEYQSSTGLGHNLSQNLYVGVTITFDNGFTSITDTEPTFTVTDTTGELNLTITSDDYSHNHS